MCKAEISNGCSFLCKKKLEEKDNNYEACEFGFRMKKCMTTWSS